MSTALLWVVFGALILGLLAVDLFVFHRRPHAIRLKEALLTSAFWIALALLFTGWVYLERGSQTALEFFTGYLIEESLSVDNLFVFLLIFRYFAVPAPFQHKVLFWGILGALVMRLAFIFAGISLLERFHVLVYLFGAILVVSGIRMWTQQDVEVHPERNLLLRWFRRLMPVTPGYEQDRFTVVREGRRWATPLLVVLLMVETTDLLFAVDSIPAVLAITRDPFIVYSSNVFAILGLRSIYFALAGVMQVFHYLHYGLSLILVFVGLKMIASDFVHVPIAAALGVIGAILAGSIVLSILRPRAVTLPPESRPPAS